MTADTKSRETGTVFSDSFLGAKLVARGTGVERHPSQGERAWLSRESQFVSGSVVFRPGERVVGTKYRIVRRLGTGAMGVVYEAVHIDTERRAALKIMRHDFGSDPEAVALFRQEARVASHIGSEHIVQALDFVELDDGRFMYVMEHVEGDVVDLELVDGPLSVARTIAIVRQVARGLAAAHDAGVVHRDIKPENIMLERDGERRDHVKILDFGVSSISSSVSRAETDVVGTPYYIAPELVLHGESGPKVDQYSLGCAAYEMLTGSPPFACASVREVLDAHVKEPPEPITVVAPELDAVIARCLAKDPEDRFDDMRDFEAALLEAQHAAGVVTEWDHLSAPAVDPDRRAALIAADADHESAPSQNRRVFAFVAAAAALALVAVTVALALPGDGSENPVPVATPAAESQGAPLSKTEADAVARGVAAARDAAANGRTVYPPASDPSASTAYAEVLKLEARRSTLAAERAAELRVELGGQLRRIADHYWLERPDSPLVAELYAEVIMFIPGDAMALRRSGLDDDALETLRGEAAQRDFAPGRLLDVEPLAILGEADSAKRAERLAAYDVALAEREDRPRYAAEFAGLVVLRSPFAHEEEDSPDETAAVGDGSEPSIVASPAATKQKATRLVEKGQYALRHGKNKTAEAAFSAALKLHPKLSAAHDGLARVNFGRSNFRKAARHGQKAVALSPGNLDYRIHLGDALFRLGRYTTALKHYETASAGGRADGTRRAAKARAKL